MVSTRSNSSLKSWRNKKDPQGITKIMERKKKINPTYVSKHNSNFRNKLFFQWFHMEKEILSTYLSEGIHKTKCKYWYDDKNVQLAELNINIAPVFLNTQTLKMI